MRSKSESERVLLKRPWRTPKGRFPKSISGVPSLVPKHVLDAYPIPSDAVIVDENYVPPDDRVEDPVSTDMTAAEMDEEIKRRVDAQLAANEAKKRGQRMVAEESEVEVEGDILDGNVKDIVDNLSVLTLDRLEELLEQERAGKSRRGVLVAIEAAIEDSKDQG